MEALQGRMGTGNNGPGSSLGEKEEKRRGETAGGRGRFRSEGKEGAGSSEKVSPLCIGPLPPKGLFAKPQEYCSFHGKPMGVGPGHLIAEQESTACFASVWVCEGGQVTSPP